MMPVRNVPLSFHVGTLDPARRSSAKDSLEGPCLSVSHCPFAWRRIAKLGNAPLQAMRFTGDQDRALFLDVLAIERGAPLFQDIVGWGTRNGLVSEKTMFKAWEFDTETEEWRYSLHVTPEVAREELEALNPNEALAAPDGHEPIEPATILAGTPALEARVQHARLDQIDAFDFLALVWAMETQPQLLGIWWTETYDPDALSAPRGGVFPDRLPQFLRATVPTAIEDSPMAMLGDPLLLDADGTLRLPPWKRPRKGARP